MQKKGKLFYLSGIGFGCGVGLVVSGVAAEFDPTIEAGSIRDWIASLALIFGSPFALFNGLALYWTTRQLFGPLWHYPVMKLVVEVKGGRLADAEADE